MLKENHFILEYMVDMFLTRVDLSDKVVLWTYERMIAKTRKETKNELKL